ncbi:hypothetical protein [Methanospirillum hungatei]|uniref:hypothetical protein n=1 Tax=Methanospirillum hungatei TaxID=2203 RepID=UPI0026ED141B|nr:hypothetical protein [Methanospirillum hungatei]MCA1917020.1 hypothetical protein [Methanospirillum hungatei]
MARTSLRLFSLLSGILIIFLGVYAFFFPDVQIYAGIFLFVLYFIIGLIRQHSASHQFFRFCLGESAAIALWFIAPVLGVISALLITGAFLNEPDILKNRNGVFLLALWTFGISLLAFMSRMIQHTLLPGITVLFLAGLVALALLLYEYRMIYHAGGNKL